MDPLFPALPEDLSVLSDADLQTLVDEHLEAQRMIREGNTDFLGDLQAPQIIEQAKQGKEQLASLRALQAERAEAIENYASVIAELTTDEVAEETAPEVEEAAAEVVAEAEEILEEAAAEVVEPVEEPIAAAALPVRRPVPQPTRERAGRQADESEGMATLTAAASLGRIHVGEEIDAQGFTKLMLEQAHRIGRPKKSVHGTEEKYLLASANYRFPEERILTVDAASNGEKIMALKNTEGNSLLASGGLCAPATNIYTIPQFATMSRPVRDALVSFRADRGAVNVPVPTTLSSAANAITIITEANDALGGTFATKACLDQTCLSYVETAVTIISHCREYGNLNARSWPESVTYENELTMAEHARVAEQYLLDRIKAQSLQVTAADVYSTTYDMIYAIVRAVAGIRYRLRASENTRFRLLAPSWLAENMIADAAATQFGDRFISRQRATSILENAGVNVSYYLDNVTGGTSQGFADEASSSTLDNFPNVVQFALFIEGAFIHVDGGTLELGLVRDSTLNSTNDFQMFGESFENVALLAPAQGALWISASICPSGQFPALTTALSC